jgi:diguanylate cyclase
MIELYEFALDSIELGIIIIDSSQCIRFWNKYMENITQIGHDNAIGRLLGDVCETFQKKRYQDILESVLVQNQSRFCSSLLHKAFAFPAAGNRSDIRQNMKIVPKKVNNEVYALIQIDDITDEVSNEHNMASLINELKRGYLEAKESEELNKKLAQMDPLTKIANRHAIIKYLDTLFENRANLRHSALMFLDLDGFKKVNDTYGHIMGDNLLIEIAGVLKRRVRKDDIVARLGGDEFLVLLSDIESVESVKAVGNKLVTEIAKPIVMEGVTIQVTVSIGIAMYEDNIKDTNGFIKIADEAMYRAKHEGKNRFVLLKNV